MPAGTPNVSSSNALAGSGTAADSDSAEGSAEPLPEPSEVPKCARHTVIFLRVRADREPLCARQCSQQSRPKKQCAESCTAQQKDLRADKSTSNSPRLAAE